MPSRMSGWLIPRRWRGLIPRIRVSPTRLALIRCARRAIGAGSRLGVRISRMLGLSGWRGRRMMNMFLLARSGTVTGGILRARS